MCNFDLSLYLVTDSNGMSDDIFYKKIEDAISGGVTIVQLREKTACDAEFLKKAAAVKKICKGRVPFIINDRVDIAKAVDADGVHLGENDMSVKDARKILGNDKIIGKTAKTVEKAIEAQNETADYFGIGAFFKTGTKNDALVLNPETIKAVNENVKIPSVGIGGLTYENMDIIKGTGISGIAVSSAIMRADDAKSAAENLKEKFLNIKYKGDKSMYKVLTIAGSDSSGGAGIQADIKTITAHKMYAMSAITALTAQNTTGVFDIFDSTPEFVEAQLDSIFTDIYPDAIKIGMVSNTEIIKSIAKKLNEYNAKNIVVDPVMVATSGSELIKNGTVETLQKELLPLAVIITPNIPEAEVLSGMEIKTKDDMEKAAKKLSNEFNTAVLIKGGHLTDCADDILCMGTDIKWFMSKRIANPNTHGTGCTLSSAIACGLADRKSISESVNQAKEYITGALSANLNLGKGSGPLNHMFNLK